MPDTVGHYQLLETLGSGALGEVHRARDTRIGRTVAVKLVPSDICRDVAARAALLADAERAGTLSHPNIATLFEVGQEGDRVFLVFEFVPGTTLRSFMGDRPLNVLRAVGLIVQVADGLTEGHRQGLVHGNISPETVMVTPTGRAKILEFGLSRWTAAGAARAAASKGIEDESSVLGSIAYMSPEQVLGSAIDQRSDIFSLGVVLYEMLTGQSPFVRKVGEPTTVQILGSAVPPAGSLNSRVPPDLDNLIQRSLSRSLEGRPQSAAAVAAELRAMASAIETEEPEVEPAPPIPRARPERRRAPRLAVAVLLLLILAVVAAWFWSDRGIEVWRRLVNTIGEAIRTEPADSPESRATPDPAVPAEPVPGEVTPP